MMNLQEELAPALSMLCQGYLVTFSNEHGEPDIDKRDPLYDIVDRSLDLMGWRRLCRSSGATSHRRVDFLQKRGAVMRSSWWAPIFEGEVFPEQEVSKVVGPHTGQLVGRIFKRVKSEALPVEPELTIDVVAPAFLELYNYLGQAETCEHVLISKPSSLIISSWEDVTSRIAQDSATLYQLDWKQFENFIAHLLEKFGWSTEPMGYTKDEGIDIIAVRKVEPDIDFRMMVQCKRFAPTRKVGVEIVRELWAVKWEKRLHKAMIATTSSFTKGAIEKANVWDFDLKDHQAITNWCKKYGDILALKNT